MLKPMLVASALVAIGVSGTALAEKPPSASAAKELTALLDGRKLDSVATQMPGEEDRFVAALYYPNAQLLVVSARYGAPALLKEQIWSKKYRDVYVTLNGSGMREGKLFVHDTGANGLAPIGAEEGDINIIYDEVETQTILNGDWKSQKLSEDKYKKRHESAETRYAAMLAALVAELKTGS